MSGTGGQCDKQYKLDPEKMSVTCPLLYAETNEQKKVILSVLHGMAKFGKGLLKGSTEER